MLYSDKFFCIDHCKQLINTSLTYDDLVVFMSLYRTLTKHEIAECDVSTDVPYQPRYRMNFKVLRNKGMACKSTITNQTDC